MEKTNIISTRTIMIGMTVLISTLIFSIQGCSLQPAAWQPPIKPQWSGTLTLNEKLRNVERIHLDDWHGPEDIAVDREGNLYTGVRKTRTDFSDGGIIKIDTSGRIELFADTGSWVTGLEFDAAGHLVACDQERGLIRVDKKGRITVLARKDEQNRPLSLPNDVDIASDGMIYFSNTSFTPATSMESLRKIILEIKPDGGLYQYDPGKDRIKTLIEGAFFANGVAVSKSDDFVLLVELAKYRVLRYWLKGDQKGQTDIFIDNLPGFPNGISRSQDGGFWLGFSTKRNDLLDRIHPTPWLKSVIHELPQWMQPGQEPFGMILKLSKTGEIVNAYFDTSGKTVSEASSVEEHDGTIYIGGDMTDHIGKYRFK